MTKDGLLAMVKSSALKFDADTATGLRKVMKGRYIGLQNLPSVSI